MAHLDQKRALKRNGWNSWKPCKKSFFCKLFYAKNETWYHLQLPPHWLRIVLLKPRITWVVSATRAKNATQAVAKTWAMGPRRRCRGITPYNDTCPSRSSKHFNAFHGCTLRAHPCPTKNGLYNQYLKWPWWKMNWFLYVIWMLMGLGHTQGPGE